MIGNLCGRIGNQPCVTIFFDMKSVSDKATYAKPAQPSVGFDYVIVNGVVLVEKGKLNTKVMPGKPIRNSQK